MAEHETERSPRWATRAEAMVYGRLGATAMNELLQSRKITAKKRGNKVIVDLNSVDAYYKALPDVEAKPKKIKKIAG
jgi:hypothetical protein